MKHFYRCLLLPVLVAARLSAAPTPAGPTNEPVTPDPVRATLNNIFAPLDKTQVPTGLLAEYALPLVPLDVFDGTLTDSSRTTPDGFRYIYATLYSAAVSSYSPLPSIQNLNARLAAAEASAGPGTIPVMVQCVSYAAVRPDAFSLNLLSYQNGQVFDVAGRAQSPYVARTAFAAAPARTYSNSGTVSLMFPASLYTQHGGAPVGWRYVDFGDGRGYIYFREGETLAATYPTAGTKRIKVRFSYYSGLSYESHFDVQVTGVSTSAAVTQIPAAARGTTAFDGRVEPIPGVRAGGTARVVLAAGHTHLTKPLIVAEGFDPHVVAPITQDNYSVETFVRAITNPTANFFFQNQLFNAGYDIVFIDYDNGTDDILLNARLFEEVLTRVNASKVGTEQNVVLGISMGGLVARYQLADMVKNGRPTQTRLLILQDSPQRGANVPLGLQALVRQVVSRFGNISLLDIDQKLNQLTKLLDAPATRQLLLYRAIGPSGVADMNSFIEGDYRAKVTFPAGQVPPYQIVAASQGAQCGTPLFAPSAELIRGDGRFFLSPMPWISRYSYRAQVIVNALPANGQSSRLATMQAYTQLRLFGFINIRLNALREDYQCPAGLLAVDGVAGGTQYISERVPAGTIPDPVNASFLPFFSLFFNSSLVRDFCFVPTASALDVADFNQSSLDGKFINGTASASFSRADNFITQEPFQASPGTLFNEFHTTFSARNSRWMFNEMQRYLNPTAPNTAGCTTECLSAADLVVTGPSTICGPATFSTPLTGRNATYTWTATPASAFTVASGTGPTFTTSNVGNSYGTITLRIGGDCPITLSKGVSIGAPSMPATQQLEPLDGCTNLAANFQIADYSPASLSYSLATTGGLRKLSGIRSDGTFTIKAGGTGGSIFLSASNACGTTTSQTDIVLEGCGNYAYTVAPNPAADEVQVQETGTEPTAKSGGISSVRVYDGYGRLRLERPGHGARALRLPLRELPAGLYTVHVLRGNAVVSRQRLQIAR